MIPHLRSRLGTLELRQRYLYKRYDVCGPPDMDCATALRLLKIKPRPGDEVNYQIATFPNVKPWIVGRYDLISDAEWKTMKNEYPRSTNVVTGPYTPPPQSASE